MSLNPTPRLFEKDLKFFKHRARGIQRCEFTNLVDIALWYEQDVPKLITEVNRCWRQLNHLRRELSGETPPDFLQEIEMEDFEDDRIG